MRCGALLTLFWLGLFWPGLGCSPVQGYCAAAAECDSPEARLDAVGEDNDSIEVCVAEREGFLRELRANEEEVCHEQARLFELYADCVAQAFAADAAQACSGFLTDDNPCEDELGDFVDATSEADDDCGSDER